MKSGECSARVQIDAGCPPRTIRKTVNDAGTCSASCARSAELSAELLATSPASTLPLRPVERLAPNRRICPCQEVASQALVSAPFRKYRRNSFRERCVHHASSKVCFAGNVSGSRRRVRSTCCLCAELRVIKKCGHTVLRGQRGDHKNYSATLRNDLAAI